jgi:deoxyinosine 3'endonuclease (endonuclease V)
MSQQRDWAQIMKNNILLGHLIQQQQTKELIIVLGKYVAMATTIKCVSKVLKFKVYSTNIISCKY